MTHSFRNAFRMALATGVLLFGVAAADAVPIVFNFATNPDSTPGDLGTDVLDFGLLEQPGLVVNGYYFNGAWLPANLFRRNDADDHGLGVCNPFESCPDLTSGGDINELDNKGKAELIRLTLPENFRWVLVGLSSLDTNSGGPRERGRLWADSDGNPSNGLGAILWEFEGGGPVEPNFSIPAAKELSRYLFFQPIDWKNNTNDNNDFLVRAALIEELQVPEPATAALMGTVLMALALTRRRS